MPQNFPDTVWISDETHFVVRNVNILCCEVMWTLGITSTGVAHPLSTVCKGHYTLSSALHISSSPNMASLDHSGTGITTSGLWQPAPSDRFRCLANLDITWSTKRGRQGPTVVPAGWCHSHTSKESLAWLQQRFPDRLISQRCDPEWSPHSPDLNAQVFILRRSLKNRIYDINYPWSEVSNHGSNKSDHTEWMWEGHREHCLTDPKVLAAPGISFRAHFLIAS